MRIVTPVATRVVVGPTPILAEVDAAAGRRIVTVRIYADGALLAILREPPWQAVFDAGEAIRGHSLRVEAVDDRGTEGRSFGTTLYLPFVDEIDVRGDFWKAGLVSVNVLDDQDEPRHVVQSELSARLSLRVVKVESAVVDTRPLAVELLFDLSGSTIPYHMMMRTAAERFISTLLPADRQEVLLFDATTWRLAPFGSDHHLARRALVTQAFIDPLTGTGGGKTRLYDALVTAIESVNPRSGQRSILVLTDTFDAGSLTSWEEIRQVVRHAGIRIDLFRFGTTPALHRNAFRRLVDQFEKLVVESGGMQWRILDPEDLAPAFRQLERQLRARYRVQLDAGAQRTPGWKRLGLEVRRKKCWVLAPEGIYFPAPGDSGGETRRRR